MGFLLNEYATAVFTRDESDSPEVSSTVLQSAQLLCVCFKFVFNVLHNKVFWKSKLVEYSNCARILFVFHGYN